MDVPRRNQFLPTAYAYHKGELSLVPTYYHGGFVRETLFVYDWDNATDTGVPSTALKRWDFKNPLGTLCIYAATEAEAREARLKVPGTDRTNV